MRLFGIPGLPLLLVLGGLIPFVAAAAILWAAPETGRLHAKAGMALLVYSAVILSFLGGIRWGAEINAQGSGGLPRGPILNLSVTGPLAGWAMVLWGSFIGLSWPLLAAAALAHFLQGLWDSDGAALPIWFRRLRVFGAAGAVWSLAAGAVHYALR